MKNTIRMKAIRRIAGIVALAAIIGFSFAACDDGGGPNLSIEGVWESSGGARVTVSGTSGTRTAWGNLNPLGEDARNKGMITLNMQWWRNISSTGDLRWSGQVRHITYNTSAPNVATGTAWSNCTFAMSADGNTLTISSTADTGAYSTAYTRR